MSSHKYEYEKAIQELRNQGFTVEIRTPQDGSWVVSMQGESFILTQWQMVHLRRQGKLSLSGIKELDKHLKAAALHARPRGKPLAGGAVEGMKEEPMNELLALENYIDAVLNEAEMDPDWQAASLRSEVAFNEIRLWAIQRGSGSLIQAGSYLFVQFFKDAKTLAEVSPLMARVLLRAAGKAFRGEISIPTNSQKVVAEFYRAVRTP